MLDSIYLILFLLAVVTYLTRIGGYLVLTRFKHIHPRVEAGLEAVPAAVIATLVAPAAITNGIAEMLAMAVAVLACLRFSPVLVLAIGVGVLIAARSAGL